MDLVFLNVENRQGDKGNQYPKTKGPNKQR